MIQPYVEPENQSAGVITFHKNLKIMEINSLNREGCKAVVDGSKPTYLSLMDEHKNFISNARHLSKVMLDNMYSAMSGLAEHDEESFQIEYVIDHDDQTFYPLQFKQLKLAGEQASYFDPKALLQLEYCYQRVDQVQAIVPGNHAVLEAPIVNYDTIEQAHKEVIERKHPTRNTICVIHERPSHSMGSHYLCNFQSLGITVIYAPKTKQLSRAIEQGTTFLCSPQQHMLFVPYQEVPHTLNLAEHVTKGMLYYLIPEEIADFQYELKEDSCLLACSIERFLSIKKEIDYHITRQIRQYLSEKNQEVWLSGFNHNENFRDLLIRLNHHGLLPSCCFLFGEELEKKHIDEITHSMKKAFAHLRILDYSQILFQDIEKLQQDYERFQKICKQLNEFLLDNNQFNLYYPFQREKIKVQAQQIAPNQLEQYVYVHVFKTYIEFMDSALKRIAASAKRNNKDVYQVFCSILEKFGDPYWQLNTRQENDRRVEGIALGWELRLEEETTLFKCFQALKRKNLSIASERIPEQYTYPEEFNSENATAAQLWTKLHAMYEQKLFNWAMCGFLRARWSKNEQKLSAVDAELLKWLKEDNQEELQKILRTDNINDLKKLENQNIVNFPKIIRERLDEIPTVYFAPRGFSFNATATLDDKLTFIFNNIYSITTVDNLIFLIVRIRYTSHGYYMAIPVPLNNSIDNSLLKIYLFADTGIKGNKTVRKEFANSHEWFVFKEMNNSEAEIIRVIKADIQQTKRKQNKVNLNAINEYGQRVVQPSDVEQSNSKATVNVNALENLRQRIILEISMLAEKEKSIELTALNDLFKKPLKMDDLNQLYHCMALANKLPNHKSTFGLKNALCCFLALALIVTSALLVCLSSGALMPISSIGIKIGLDLLAVALAGLGLYLGFKTAKNLFDSPYTHLKNEISLFKKQLNPIKEEYEKELHAAAMP